MSVGGSTVVADGWGWRFGANPSPRADGVSFTISAGERVLLLGPSGSGKSTLLRALAGLLSHDEGTSIGRLTVDGIDARTSRDHGATVGLVLQDPETQAVLSRVGDDVAFGCENLGVPADLIWSRVHEALESVGLDVDLDHPTSALSGGQKQRLALAGVLAMQPSLILLDEPTANLDPQGAQLVKDSVARVVVKSEATLVIVEHRVDLWWQLVDRIVVLGASGELIADGAPQAVLESRSESLRSSGVWLPDFFATPLSTGPQGESLLITEQLKIARRGGAPLTADFELSVAAGEFVVVTGANGVGKTTLALTIGGLTPPASGAVIAKPTLARGLRSAPLRWSSRQLRDRIGNVFQSPAHQFVRSSVREELALSAGRSIFDARIDEMLERLQLAEIAGSNPFALSGGQQRRLSVATALMTKPALLVLDEPTFGQDARTWLLLVDAIAQLSREGAGIIAMSHDHHLAAAATRRVEL